MRITMYTELIILALLLLAVAHLAEPAKSDVVYWGDAPSTDLVDVYEPLDDTCPICPTCFKCECFKYYSDIW